MKVKNFSDISALFGKSSECESETVPTHGAGSKGMKESVAGSKGGLTCTPSPLFSRTSSISGTKATVVNLTIGESNE